MTESRLAVAAQTPDGAVSHTPTTRHYVMTAPTFFGVEYAINPWMDTSVRVDAALAVSQWDGLRQTYHRLGHTPRSRTTHRRSAHGRGPNRSNSSPLR